MSNQSQEFKVFGIPVWMRKYIYGSIVFTLISFIIILYVDNKNCQKQMFKEMKNILDKELNAKSNEWDSDLKATQNKLDSISSKLNKK